MLSLFLFPPNRVSVLVGKLAAENLDKVNKISDAEQASRQQVEDARAGLADIEAMNAETAKEEAEQENCVAFFYPHVILSVQTCTVGRHAA